MEPEDIDKKKTLSQLEPIKINESQDMLVIGIKQMETRRKDFHNLVDILFVLDTTGSMSWSIKESKKTITKIIKTFLEKQYNIRFALELYRDHKPQQYSYVQKHFDLRTEQQIIQVLNQDCEACGGGDIPQAVMDGLFYGLKKTSWRKGTDGKTKSKRFLFHCCDAPPHGKQYGQKSNNQNWQQNGCPCGITKFNIEGLLSENKVDYFLIKVGKRVDLMQSIFKKCFSLKLKNVISLDIKNKSANKLEKRIKAKKIYDKQQQQYRKYLKQQGGCCYRSFSSESEQYDQEQEQNNNSSDELSLQEELYKIQIQQKKVQKKISMATFVCSQIQNGLLQYQNELQQQNK